MKQLKLQFLLVNDFTSNLISKNFLFQRCENAIFQLFFKILIKSDFSIFSHFFSGFAWAGFSVNHLDVAPQYAAILMGISNTIGTIPGIISPAITGYLVEDKSTESWQHVFIITAFVYALGAIFYGIFASGDRQDWSKMEHEDELVLATYYNAPILK